MISCGSSKNSTSTSRKTYTTAERVVANALKYTGVKYKFGGTTRKGMDCSGVVYVAFGEENIEMPRVSRNMAKEGKKISLNRAKMGDLLFFKTSKTRNRINHVGLIISNKKGVIRFIHSTSSRGVIVSSLSEKYWKRAFVKATNLL